MTDLIAQNDDTYPLMFFMADSTDKVTGKTGLAPTVVISKAGGAFAAPAGAVTQVGNGWYQVAGNAADTDTVGPLVLSATAAGAVQAKERYCVLVFINTSDLGLGGGRYMVAPGTSYGATGD